MCQRGLVRVASRRSSMLFLTTLAAGGGSDGGVAPGADDIVGMVRGPSSREAGVGVRGYGLVDSEKVAAEPGSSFDLSAEGGAGNTSKAIKFQLRPDPLAG